MVKDGTDGIRMDLTDRLRFVRRSALCSRKAILHSIRSHVGDPQH